MLNEMLAHSVVFHEAFPSEVSDYVNRHLGQHRLEILDKEASRACLHYRDFANIGLSKISYGNQTRVISPDLIDIYHFQLVTCGQCFIRVGQKELLLHKGEALMLNPNQAHELIYSDNCEKLIVKVPREILNVACLNLIGNVPRSGVSFDSSRLLNVNQSLSLMRLFEAVLHEADHDEFNPSCLDVSYRNLLLQKMISSFPSNISKYSEESSCDRILKRALTFIREHIKEEITVDELANLCNISTRSLYNLFAKYLDNTPKQYIKNERLKHLQNEILHNRKVRNVTEVAMDYGFTHLGRFSSDYRRLFGELPSETFRRSRG